MVVVSEGARNAGAALATLRQAGIEVVERYDAAHTKDPSIVIDALNGAWGVIAGGAEPYTAEVLAGSHGLRVIARPGVGYEMIDLEAATNMRIAVFTTPGANDESVADYALTLILACLFRLMLVDRTVRSGGWRPIGLSRELFGSTVGIIGLGRIGRAVARRLRAFQCRIIAVEPTPDLEFCEQHGVELRSLNEMLPLVDVLTVHVPLTPSTRHLVGRPELGLLKRGAIVVNTARGGIIDETALIEAVEAGWISGAGLDVFEHEPLRAEHPVRSLPNVVLSGHVAALTVGARLAVADG